MNHTAVDGEVEPHFDLIKEGVNLQELFDEDEHDTADNGPVQSADRKGASPSKSVNNQPSNRKPRYNLRSRGNKSKLNSSGSAEDTSSLSDTDSQSDNEVDEVNGAESTAEAEHAPVQPVPDPAPTEVVDEESVESDDGTESLIEEYIDTLSEDSSDVNVEPLPSSASDDSDPSVTLDILFQDESLPLGSPGLDIQGEVELPSSPIPEVEVSHDEPGSPGLAVQDTVEEPPPVVPVIEASNDGPNDIVDSTADEQVAEAAGGIDGAHEPRRSRKKREKKDWSFLPARDHPDRPTRDNSIDRLGISKAVHSVVNRIIGTSSVPRAIVSSTVAHETI